MDKGRIGPIGRVSTHSRLKAAGFLGILVATVYERFNTQPPEGGWRFTLAERVQHPVSTHSRLKAAGSYAPARSILTGLFQHTAA